MKECEECEGTGVVATLLLDYVIYDPVEIECPICNGTGEVD